MSQLSKNIQRWDLCFREQAKELARIFGGDAGLMTGYHFHRPTPKRITAFLWQQEFDSGVVTLLSRRHDKGRISFHLVLALPLGPDEGAHLCSSFERRLGFSHYQNCSLGQGSRIWYKLKATNFGRSDRVLEGLAEKNGLIWPKAQDLLEDVAHIAKRPYYLAHLDFHTSLDSKLLTEPNGHQTELDWVRFYEAFEAAIAAFVSSTVNRPLIGVVSAVTDEGSTLSLRNAHGRYEPFCIVKPRYDVLEAVRFTWDGEKASVVGCLDDDDYDDALISNIPPVP